MEKGRERPKREREKEKFWLKNKGHRKLDA